MHLPSHKHIQIWCKQCKKYEIVLTKTNHYCSPKCFDESVKEYWKDRYLVRKVDPVAREHVRRAKKKYKEKLKLQDEVRPA